MADGPSELSRVWCGHEKCILFNQVILLHICGNETEDASKAHLSTAAQKPEEICKEGCLLGSFHSAYMYMYMYILYNFLKLHW